MRRAIANAEVDDDCYGTDPTANALEATVAELLGKEAAIFTITGTMANCLAIGAQSRPGDEILYEAKAHPINYEAGAPSGFFGVQTTGIPSERGLLDPQVVDSYIRRPTMHQPDTVLLSVENTHNAHGGSVYPVEQLHALAHVAHDRGILAHLDGARLWNAAIATGLSEKTLCQPYDTVSVCFSKGLGAPMGSALAGEQAVIDRARKIRRRMGGGWRQAGILAAGALFAIEHHRERLSEDHRRAQWLATELAKIDGLTPLTPCDSNILMVDVQSSPLDAWEWNSRLIERGVLQNAINETRLRLVTHLDIHDEDTDYAINVFHEIAGN
jgi:threonine aldolase